MTDTEILTKAIEKAVKNGWKPKGLTKAPKLKLGNVFYVYDNPKWLTVEFTYWGETFKDKPDNKSHWFSFEQIIFSHSFAKAYFKGSPTRWDIHLQRMVICPNPIRDYLKRYEEGELK